MRIILNGIFITLTPYISLLLLEFIDKHYEPNIILEFISIILSIYTMMGSLLTLAGFIPIFFILIYIYERYELYNMKRNNDLNTED